MVKSTPPAKSSIALDLDALAPNNVEVNFQGKKIKVNPPSLEQYSKVIDAATELSDIKDKKMTSSDSIEIYRKLNNLIVELIPELKGQNLNYMQIIALFNLIAEMGAPSGDTALNELKKRGISISPSKDKKTPKASA